MLKLAGALLNKPEALQRLARIMPEAPAVQAAARLARGGGSEILRSAIPGAVITAGLGAIDTGNPLAGAAIGLADLGLSYGGSRAVSKYMPRMAGRYRAYVSPEEIETARSTGVGISPQNLSQVYEPSVLQHTAMLGSSIAAPLLLEPMFMQQPQVTNQNVTQQQQLGQMEYLNQMYPSYTADGTLYQLQGLPPRVTQ